VPDREKQVNEARYHVIAELAGTEGISAHFTTHRFRPHFHDTFLVGVTESGAELFQARGGTHISPAGSLRLLNPGEVHTGRPPESGAWTYRCLYPPEHLLEEIALDLGRGVGVSFRDMIVTDASLAREFLAAFATLDRPATRLERASRFREVLARIIATASEGRVRSVPTLKREPRALAAAESFITDRFADDFTLEELSREAGMSPFHLVRVFKAQRGLTPFTFQSQLRVQRAQVELRRGRSVDATARACGFFDRSHLTKVFRAFVGVTPTIYRRALVESAR
jgi:AraC-like DNA-binding protein